MLYLEFLNKFSRVQRPRVQRNRRARVRPPRARTPPHMTSEVMLSAFSTCPPVTPCARARGGPAVFICKENKREHFLY